jgi:hypothetical protein
METVVWTDAVGAYDYTPNRLRRNVIRQPANI